MPPHPDSLKPHAATCASATASAAADTPESDCGGGEPFALMVLGHSMVPEFNEGEIIIIEPEGLAHDGSYVLAWHQDEWTFRQLLQDAAGWLLHPLNPAFADVLLPDLSAVRGVIIQKSLPGRRRAAKHYV